MLRAMVLIGVTVALITSTHAGATPTYQAWSTPVNLGPVVNSGVIDGGPAVSKHGLSLFFGSNRAGGFGANDLWVTQRARSTDPWGAPVNLGAAINTGATDGAPALSRDGHWLFFFSNRPGGFGQIDIWGSYRPSTRDAFGWQAPVNLGPGVNSAFVDQGATYFENHGAPLLFFNSNRPGGLGFGDIYVSARQRDGSFGPAQLVKEVSSPANEIRASIRFDGLEMILTSNRAGGYGGYDLYVSTRKSTTDPWTIPVNLGATVNSVRDDQQPCFASDRMTLYFASSRLGGSGGLDLYVTTRARI